jgi:hypothetical protein
MGTIGKGINKLLSGLYDNKKNCDINVVLAEKKFTNVSVATIKHNLCAKNVFTVYNSDTNALEDFSVVDDNSVATITLVSPKNITVKYFKNFKHV